MPTSAYFRRQAEQLPKMARNTIDINLAERLRMMAADFHERARELDKLGAFVPMGRHINDQSTSDSEHG